MLFQTHVNWLAIVVAMVAAMALGAVWYGALLGKQWMAALGKTREEITAGGNPAVPMVIAAIAELVMAYFLAILMPAVYGAVNWQSGLHLGFWLWVGFLAPALILNHRFQGQKWSLTIIDGAYLLGVMLVEGVVIGLFGAAA
jgi:hypothetical protein